MMCYQSLPRTPFLALVALGLVIRTAYAACSRDELIAAADVYVAAQAAGDIAPLRDLMDPAEFVYWESNMEADIETGVLTTALTIDHHRSTADTEACASYTELIATGPTPYVIGTQLRHNASSFPSKNSLSKIDTIAATAPALFFNASRTLELVLEEDWTALAVESQPTRDELQNAIDAYLDMWSDGSAFDAVPWGEPCHRIEGSNLFEPCSFNTPRSGGMTRNGKRRYVLDEVAGSASALCEFTSVGQIPDVHEIRLVDGKTRYVHTITLCATGPGGNWPMCEAAAAAAAAAAAESDAGGE